MQNGRRVTFTTYQLGRVVLAGLGGPGLQHVVLSLAMQPIFVGLYCEAQHCVVQYVVVTPHWCALVLASASVEAATSADSNSGGIPGCGMVCGHKVALETTSLPVRAQAGEGAGM